MGLFSSTRNAVGDVVATTKNNIADSRITGEVLKGRAQHIGEAVKTDLSTLGTTIRGHGKDVINGFKTAGTGKKAASVGLAGGGLYMMKKGWDDMKHGHCIKGAGEVLAGAAGLAGGVLMIKKGGKGANI